MAKRSERTALFLCARNFDYRRGVSQ
jgi:hypothetical protein